MRPSSRVKTFCLAILTVIITITTPIYAQSQQGYPAPSNVRDSKYPYINSDLRVTFTLKAPLAKKVQVVGLGDGNGLSEKPIDLVRDQQGLWRVTTPPARPGFHYYQFIIDGVQVNDPGSETYFGWGKPTSGLEVTDPKLDFYHAKQVLRLLWLACDTQDNLFAANQKAHQELAKARIKHVWLTGSGAHEWQVWRKYLYNFAPKLFEYNRSAVGWQRGSGTQH